MATESSESGMGMMVGLVLILVMGILFFVYGLPMMRSAGTTQINVPDTIDVNVNQQPAQ